MDLPTRINPCPIVDNVIELRYRSSVEPGAIFGILYGAFRNDYPIVEKMPVLNIPEEIRQKDAQLAYQPWYRLRNGGFVVAIGPRTIYLGKTGEYAGWTVVSERLRRVVEILQESNIVGEIERVGLRYINFFEFDIFEHIKLIVSINDKPITENETLVRSIVKTDRFRSRLTIANQTSIEIEKVEKKGSIIDIDTFLDEGLQDFFRNADSIMEEGHNEEKDIFFSLLKEDFLLTLNPEY